MHATHEIWEGFLCEVFLSNLKGLAQSVQEKGYFRLTLATPLFVKDLRNPQFSNSGAKVVIMWGYTSGVNIYGAKVKKLILMLDKYVAFHGLRFKDDDDA